MIDWAYYIFICIWINAFSNEGTYSRFRLPGIAGIICVVISIVLITSNLYDALLLIISTIAVFIAIIVVLYK